MICHSALLVETYLTGRTHAGAHPFSGTQQPRFDGSKGKSADNRIVLLLHAFQVALFNDVAIFRSELGKHTGNTGTQRVNRFAYRFRLRNIIRQFGYVAPQPVMIDQCIARHQEQPCTIILQRAELFALLHGLDEHFLQQVIGKVRILGTVPEEVAALVENGLSPLDQRFLTDMVGPSALSDRRGRIDVIPAFGRRSIKFPTEVLAKIARAYAEDMGPDGTIYTILDQVRHIVDHFSDPKRYDVILVRLAGRTSETTASAILGLGADVFLFGLNERQTFQGYSALLAHLAKFVTPGAPLPEWVERITMVQGRASTAVEDRVSFIEKCDKLFNDTGFIKSRTEAAAMVKLPAAPFRDVPWDDTIPDDALGLEDDFGPREPIAILDDERFRLFDPARHNDLLSEQAYNPLLRCCSIG